MEYDPPGDEMKGGICICLAASKGGVGKTTLTAALAVRASEEAERVALLDLDPQHSTARWWELRGRPNNPRLFTGVESVADDVSLLKARGWQWVFIDTPGSGHENIMEPAILAADFVLIPVKASAIDVEAIFAVADLCRKRRKSFAFVLNDFEPKWKASEGAEDYLTVHGRVLDMRIHHRQAHLVTMGAGRTGAEFNDKRQAKAAADEIDALWLAVRRLAMVGAKR